jgi:hypothetical protein
LPLHLFPIFPFERNRRGKPLLDNKEKFLQVREIKRKGKNIGLHEGLLTGFDFRESTPIFRRCI